MTQIAFQVGREIFTVVPVNLALHKYKVFHTHFYCPTCGELWAHKIVLDEEAEHDFFPFNCPDCKEPKFNIIRETRSRWEDFGPEFELAHLVLDLLTNRY